MLFVKSLIYGNMQHISASTFFFDDNQNIIILLSIFPVGDATTVVWIAIH